MFLWVDRNAGILFLQGAEAPPEGGGVLAFRMLDPENAALALWSDQVRLIVSHRNDEEEIAAALMLM